MILALLFVVLVLARSGKQRELPRLQRLLIGERPFFLYPFQRCPCFLAVSERHRENAEHFGE